MKPRLGSGRIPSQLGIPAGTLPPATPRPLHLARRIFTFSLEARSLTLDLPPRHQSLTLPDRED